jgi:4-diphosphocytidyl-2-C-methyl-D-erythritol kinase
VTAECAHVLAQAKINLRLRVLAREESGYHSLETVFARIELGDEVRVRVGGRARTVECRGADLGPPEGNLAWRAATSYGARAGWPRGFAIEIEKRIPVGGGLGGGSADAGAVLRVLNALAPAPLGESDLLAIAAELGADVPFLTSDATLALAWGRGERMMTLTALPSRPVILILPPVSVATSKAYGWLDSAREQQGSSGGCDSTLLRADQLECWEGMSPLAVNDFEAAVVAYHPEIGAAIRVLHDAGATIARMSGSGSTVFGVFECVPDQFAIAGVSPGRVILTRTAQQVAPIHLL